MEEEEDNIALEMSEERQLSFEECDQDQFLQSMGENNILSPIHGQVSNNLKDGYQSDQLINPDSKLTTLKNLQCLYINGNNNDDKIGSQSNFNQLSPSSEKNKKQSPKINSMSPQPKEQILQDNQFQISSQQKDKIDSLSVAQAPIKSTSGKKTNLANSPRSDKKNQQKTISFQIQNEVLQERNQVDSTKKEDNEINHSKSETIQEINLYGQKLLLSNKKGENVIQNLDSLFHKSSNIEVNIPQLFNFEQLKEEQSLDQYNNQKENNINSKISNSQSNQQIKSPAKPLIQQQNQCDLNNQNTKNKQKEPISFDQFEVEQKQRKGKIKKKDSDSQIQKDNIQIINQDKQQMKNDVNKKINPATKKLSPDRNISNTVTINLQKKRSSESQLINKKEQESAYLKFNIDQQTIKDSQDNFGQFLYKKCLKIQKSNQSKNEQQQKQLEQEQLEQCTFHPQISEKAQQIKQISIIEKTKKWQQEKKTNSQILHQQAKSNNESINNSLFPQEKEGQARSISKGKNKFINYSYQYDNSNGKVVAKKKTIQQSSEQKSSNKQKNNLESHHKHQISLNIDLLTANSGKKKSSQVSKLSKETTGSKLQRSECGSINLLPSNKKSTVIEDSYNNYQNSVCQQNNQICENKSKSNLVLNNSSNQNQSSSSKGKIIQSLSSFASEIQSAKTTHSYFNDQYTNNNYNNNKQQKDSAEQLRASSVAELTSEIEDAFNIFNKLQNSLAQSRITNQSQQIRNINEPPQSQQQQWHSQQMKGVKLLTIDQDTECIQSAKDNITNKEMLPQYDIENKSKYYVQKQYKNLANVEQINISKGKYTIAKDNNATMIPNVSNTYDAINKTTIKTISTTQLRQSKDTLIQKYNMLLENAQTITQNLGNIRKKNASLKVNILNQQQQK